MVERQQGTSARQAAVTSAWRYLTWEIDLVKDMAMDDDHRFRVIAD